MSGDSAIDKAPNVGLSDMGDISFYDDPDTPTPTFDFCDIATAPDDFGSMVLNVTWAQLQSSEGGPIAANNPIDTALAELTAFNQKNGTNIGLKLRVWGGYTAPNFAKNIDGPPITITGAGTVSSDDQNETIGRFWTQDYINAWTSFQTELASEYDSNSLIREVSVTIGASASDEPFVQLHPDQSAILLAAGYTDAAEERVLRSAVADYAAWKTTPLDFTFNMFHLQQDADKQDEDFTLTAMQEALDTAHTTYVGNHALNNPIDNSVDQADAFVYGQITASAELDPLGTHADYQTASPAVMDMAAAGTTSATDTLAIWENVIINGGGADASNIEIWPGFGGFTEQTNPAFLNSLAETFAAHDISIDPSLPITAAPSVPAPVVTADPAAAVDYSWRGDSGDADFADAGNWTPRGGPPGPSDNVSFGSGLAIGLGGLIAETLVIDGGVIAVGGLVIGGAATIDDGGTLQFDGDVSASNLMISNTGTLAGDGVVNAAVTNGGTIEVTTDRVLGLATLVLGGGVTGGGTMLIDPGATLSVAGTIAGTEHIIFAPSDGAQFSEDPYAPSTLDLEDTAVFNGATIVAGGFSLADGIVLQGVSATLLGGSTSGSVVSLGWSNGEVITFDLPDLPQDERPSLTVTTSGTISESTLTLVAPNAGSTPSLVAPATLHAVDNHIAVGVPNLTLLMPLPTSAPLNTTILVTITSESGILAAQNDGGNTSIIQQSGTSLVLAGTLGAVQSSLRTLTYQATGTAPDQISFTVSDYAGVSGSPTVIDVANDATASDYQWRVTSGSGDFADAGNWTVISGGANDSAPPGGADQVTFGHGIYGVSGSGTAAEVLVGGTVTVTGAIDAPGSVVSGGAKAVLVDGGGDLVLADGGVLTTSGAIYVGAGTSGGLAVTGGGVMGVGDTADLVLGASANGVGNLLDLSDITLGGALTVGESGNGTLLMQTANAAVTDATADIGANPNASGAVAVDNGLWATAGTLTVGDAGTGALFIGPGADGVTGQVTDQAAVLGSQATGNGKVEVDGGDWLNLGALTVGGAGSGSIAINGGAVAVGEGTSSGTGTVTVGGTTATATGAIAMSVGATLEVQGAMSVGTGAASGLVAIGQSAADDALLALTGTLSVGADGLVTLDGAAADNATDGGAILRAGDITLASGGVITGSGILSGLGIGGVSFAPTTIGNSGTIMASGGDLIVDGTITGAGVLHVDSDATLTLDAPVASGQRLFLGPGSEAILNDPPAFAGAISGFAVGERIDLGGVSLDEAVWNDGTLTLSGDGDTLALHVIGDYGSDDFMAQADGTGGTVVELACFASGTRIATPGGERAVEDLRVGDLVITAGGAARPIVWLGHRHVDIGRHPLPEAVCPVRVAAHAFAPNKPCRALFLSPDHAILAEGVLIPIKCLLDGVSVARVDTPSVTYHHIELSSHDVILAEGLETETFLDTGDRSAFANAGDVVQLHPVFGPHHSNSRDIGLTWDALAYAPLRVVGPEVDRARAFLSADSKKARQMSRRRTHSLR